MTASAFLPLRATADGDGIVGLMIIPTLIYRDDTQTWENPPVTRGVSVQSRLARLEANPRRAAALKRARVRLAAETQRRNPNVPASLAGLRLAAGLSQSQLAALMNTQQSNVSRWERSPGDIMGSTIIKLAGALGVSPASVLEVIRQDQHGGV